MKHLYRILAVAALSVAAMVGQTNTLTMTTLSTAALATDSVINLASATNVNTYSLLNGTPASELYVVAPGNQRGEVMTVRSLSGTSVTVNRGRQGIRMGFPSGSMVLVGAPNLFYDYDPSGSCVLANTNVTPWVNTKTGNQWLCSSVTSSWVAGWGNDITPASPTAAVASVAGATLPSGPLFHVTGTNAITSWTLPVGFAFGSFTVIPDAAFTTTNAGNIAIASTGVVGKQITFTYDTNAGKWYPSY